MAPPFTTVYVAPPTILSRYENQKRRDWFTFIQYLGNHHPPISISCCRVAHVLEYLRYLDQFGKTKVHIQLCCFFGKPNPPRPCPCPSAKLGAASMRSLVASGQPMRNMGACVKPTHLEQVQLNFIYAKFVIRRLRREGSSTRRSAGGHYHS